MTPRACRDTTSAGVCGIGTLWPDDQITSANMNNSGPSYSRVDQGCWKGSVAAHELMHNLGGVQDSAPNSSRGGHCIDQYDVMCYSDYPYYPPMLKPMPCPANISRLDCGHNDYFNTDLAPGSYLANSWNPANNRFLLNAGALPSPPPPPVLDNTTTSMGKNKKDRNKNTKGKKSKGKIDQAQEKAALGRRSLAPGRYSAAVLMVLPPLCHQCPSRSRPRKSLPARIGPNSSHSPPMARGPL